MKLTRIRALYSYLLVTAALFLLFPSGVRAAEDLGLGELSRTVVDSYRQALEETLNRWPVPEVTASTDLKRSSRDLLERVDEVRSLLERSRGGIEPRAGYRALGNLYHAHARLTQMVLEAQVIAYEQRADKRRAAEDRGDDTDDEKKDIEKIFDVIFGSRTDSPEADRSDSAQQGPSRTDKPVEDYQRPLLIEQQILEGIVDEVRFQIRLGETGNRESHLRLWLDHLNSLLGSYLETLYQDPSLAPLFAGQYRTHLNRLLKLGEQKELEGDDQRSSVREALKRQAQILGGLDYTRSERAEKLRERIHDFLRR